MLSQEEVFRANRNFGWIMFLRKYARILDVSYSVTWEYMTEKEFHAQIKILEKLSLLTPPELEQKRMQLTILFPSLLTDANSIAEWSSIKNQERKSHDVNSSRKYWMYVN